MALGVRRDGRKAVVAVTGVSLVLEASVRMRVRDAREIISFSVNSRDNILWIE